MCRLWACIAPTQSQPESNLLVDDARSGMVIELLDTLHSKTVRHPYQRYAEYFSFKVSFSLRQNWNPIILVHRENIQFALKAKELRLLIYMSHRCKLVILYIKRSYN